MPIPEAAKAKFDRAYSEVSPHSPERTSSEVTARAAVAQVSLTEGLVIGIMEAQERLTASLDAFTEQANTSSAALVFWTRVMAVATGALVLMALTQIGVSVCWSSDFC